MKSNPIRSIRMSDEEVAEALAKAKDLGLPTLASVVRFALKRLRSAQQK